MNSTSQAGLLAIDVGSSRVKFGWFPQQDGCASPPVPGQLAITTAETPRPAETLICRHHNVPKGELEARITAWIEQAIDPSARTVIAAVHPDAATTVTRILEGQGFSPPHVLAAADLPVQLALHPPPRAGIDRLLNAVAINRLRNATQTAIVVDAGTACTVDLIGSDGVFQGGAILPGMKLSAAALHAGTSSLPLIRPHELVLPAEGVGKCTAEAISSGLYWGLLGGIGRLVSKFRNEILGETQLFLTGGDAGLLVEQLGADCGPVQHVPHLVLIGVAVSQTEALRR